MGLINIKENICVLVSGGGTNLQALIDAQKSGIITKGEIRLVISSSENAYALERAKKNHIHSEVISKKQLGESFDDVLLSTLKLHNIDLIVLAGYLSILSKRIIEVYKDKIINVHPALIPSFCGQGFYGLTVHKAALDYGVKVTGATVHYVNEVTDGGKIISQKAIDVLETDTPESLQKRVMEQCEWELLPKAVEIVCGLNSKN